MRTTSEPLPPATSSEGPAGFAWPRPLTALRHRDFRLLIIGGGLASIGYWALVVALGWQVVELTASKLTLGVVTACLSLPFLLIALPGGVIADRADRKLLMTMTRGLLTSLMVALAALTFAGLVTIPILIGMAFAAGCCFALDLPTRQSLAPELVEPHEVTNAVALNQVIFTGATMLGPPISSLMIVWSGAGGAFLLNGLCNAVLLIMVRMMRLPPRVARTERRSFTGDMSQGIGYVLHSPVLQPLMALATGLAVLIQPYQSFLPALAKDTLHIGAGTLGLLYAAGGFGAIAGAAVVASLGEIRRKGVMLLVAMPLVGLAVIGVAQSRSLPLTLALLACVGLGNAIGGTMTSTIMITTAPGELRGRVMSVNVLVFGLSPLGNLLLGALGDALDVPAALTISAMLFMTIVVLMAATRPRLRGL